MGTKATVDDSKANTKCPYCGKAKRSWRKQYPDTLCSSCDRKVAQGDEDGHQS